MDNPIDVIARRVCATFGEGFQSRADYENTAEDILHDLASHGFAIVPVEPTEEQQESSMNRFDEAISAAAAAGDF